MKAIYLVAELETQHYTDMFMLALLCNTELITLLFGLLFIGLYISKNLVRGSQLLFALLNGRNKLVVDIRDIGDQILEAPGLAVESMS